jgi:serine/threonine-protein kinase
LKPSNVMVGAFGEVQVMDWGLAKVLGSPPMSETGIQPDESSAVAPVRTAGEDLATHAGAILGTPAFMAPEQARGEIERLDERADVFGLGAILCVLLTGQPPYVGLTKAEVYRQAKEAALTDAWARLEACGADDDLVRLAKACLTPDLAERPRHAGLVAEAVAAYQAQVQQRLQQAEVARGQAEVKAQEERRRRRVTLALAVAVVVLLLGGSATGWWYLQQAAAQQRRLAEAQQGIATSLNEALKLRAAGLQQVDNPAAWGVTLAAARTALEHARTLLSQEPDLAETDLAQQARQAQAQLEADAKDWQLLAVFDQVRLDQSQLDPQRRHLNLAEAYPRLQQALADYGLAIGGLQPDQARERLRLRSPAVQKHVMAVLEECLAWVPKEEVGQQKWLAAVLALEADPWLMRFHQAVAKGAWAEMEKLAAQAEVGRYHPAVLVGLARNLPEEARASKVQLLRQTQQQYPGDFWVNYALGSELYGSVFPAGADRPARAEELRVVHEAVAFDRVAVVLRPGNIQAHTNLGAALAARGEVKEAIACYHKALDLDPKYAHAHYNLGTALYHQGDLAGAIACLRKALELNPKFAQTHLNLGLALRDQGDLAGAIACLRKALELNPKFAQTHGALGQALLAQGAFHEARAATQKALDLLPAGHPLRPLVTRQLHDCQRLLDLDARLRDLLKGEDQAKDTAEQLALADLCQRFKKRYAAAVRFYAGAFAAKPKLTPQDQAFLHYNAACAAVLAAAGQGEDADKLDAKEKSRLRQLALAWFRDNLKDYAKQLENADAKSRQAVQQALQPWQKDPDFDSVRGKEALAKLPEAERAAWQQFWADVEKLLKKAAAANWP